MGAGMAGREGAEPGRAKGREHQGWSQRGLEERWGWGRGDRASGHPGGGASAQGQGQQGGKEGLGERGEARGHPGGRAWNSAGVEAGSGGWGWSLREGWERAEPGGTQDRGLERGWVKGSRGREHQKAELQRRVQDPGRAGRGGRARGHPGDRASSRGWDAERGGAWGQSHRTGGGATLGPWSRPC